MQHASEVLHTFTVLVNLKCTVSSRVSCSFSHCEPACQDGSNLFPKNCPRLREGYRRVLRSAEIRQGLLLGQTQQGVLICFHPPPPSPTTKCYTQPCLTPLCYFDATVSFDVALSTVSQQESVLCHCIIAPRSFAGWCVMRTMFLFKQACKGGTQMRRCVDVCFRCPGDTRQPVSRIRPSLSTELQCIPGVFSCCRNHHHTTTDCINVCHSDKPQGSIVC